MSRVAFISDIHANIDALDAVLADLDKQTVDTIVCLGDIVGYGAAPEICVRRVLERCLVTVMGNHEAMLGILPTLGEHDLGSTVREPLLLAAEELSETQLTALRALPLVADFPQFAAVHSSLHQPGIFPYVEHQQSAEEHFAAQDRWPVSFHGHTHQPCIWRKTGDEIFVHPPAEEPVRLTPDGIYTVNVGSVGQPRDRDPRACYAIYDVETRVLRHRRVSYDIQKARTRILHANLPANNSLRLLRGQ